jgi:radical SAM superfamily enzyme YgiQ (UPF0313 family)
MTKTLICSFPPLAQTQPPIGSAIVASVCKKEGHDVTVVDLQAELNKFLKKKNIDLDYFDDIFYLHSNLSFSQEQRILLEEFILAEFDRLDMSKFDYIAGSLFSYLAQQFCRVFVELIRPLTSSAIIIGGTGLVNFKNSLSLYNGLTFPEELKEKKLIDEYITGEAEEALPKYFNTRQGPGIGNSNFEQIVNLDVQPWPDYTLYDLDNYVGDQGKQELGIIGSRGCVRHCTFCDVVKTTPKYRYRSGDGIAQEIIHHYETHGITNFYFTDSLVNGSFKAFDDMCNGLARYNFPTPISWSGQYIIRSKQTTPKNHFEMLKVSGCKTLFVGIESGCDRVRFELGKKFTNDDIEFYLENFLQHDIQILFLFFSGYVSETEIDHAETLSMFPRWQKYVASGTIQGIETLNIMTILPGSPLEIVAKDKNYLFMQEENSTSLNLKYWINPDLPNFDFKARVKRHVEMVEEAMKYKWPLWNGELAMTQYEEALSKYVNTPKRYIPIKSDKYFIPN